MISKKYVFLIILISFNIISYANEGIINSEKDSIIAKVGNDYLISFKDLRQYVVDWQYNLKYRDKPTAYKIALDALILNQMKRFDFFDRGLNKNEELVKNIRRLINEELTVEFFDKMFVAKYANEEKAIEAYKVMNKEVVYYQIVLPVKGDEGKERIDSLKKLASKIENELYRSKDAEKILKKYSGNDLRRTNSQSVKWEQSIKDAVAAVIFNLSKGFTRVIESIDGFYIVKVKDIKKIKVEPFEKIKTDIISKLKDGYAQIYYDEFENFRKKSVDEKTLKWNNLALEKIVEWSNLPGFYTSSYIDTIQNILKKGGNFEILSYKTGKVDLKEFLRLLDEVVIMNPQVEINVNQVKEFVLEALYSDYIVKKAKELDIEKNFFNPYTDNFILKHQIAIIYNKALIDDQIPEATETALQKFYDEQKDLVLYQLAKVNIYVRIYSDSAKAAEEINKINAGTPFEEISNRWLTKSFVRERDGELNSYLSTEPPYLAEAAFKMKENEVAGPVMYFDNEKGKQFAVIKCSAVRLAKRPTYAELKNSIKDEFNKYYKQKLSDEVERQLRNKYKVEIFDNYLSELLSSVK